MAFKRMPREDIIDVDSLSAVHVDDSEESVLSGERSTGPSWETEVKCAVRRLQDQHTGNPAGSLYLEMRARRERLNSDREDARNFDRNQPGRCIRAPWCAFTVLFWSYDHLAKRLRVLPSRLHAGMTCWVWVAHESEALWPGYEKVATCVVLLSGVPASFPVRRIAGLLLSSDGRSLDTETECSPGWWLHAMSEKDEVEDWITRHGPVLCKVNYVARASLGSNGDEERSGLLLPGRHVGKTQLSSAGRKRANNGVGAVATKERAPLADITGNGRTRR